MKSIITGIIVIVIVWIGSSLIPSQSEVTDNAQRIDAVEDNIDDIKTDLRDIKNLLMKGICHD